MRRIGVVWVVLMAIIAVSSCGNKRHDAAYYEQKVDSIRRAEQLKEIQQKAGMNDDPLKAFFDTLRYHTLPVRSEKSDFSKLGTLTDVPKLFNNHFGYSADDELKAVMLPEAFQYRVVLLAEMQDSITPVLYLYTMKRSYQPVDLLCVYEQKEEDRKDDFGKTYMEFYVTSDYEIMLMQYYISHDAIKPELFQMRRYVISKDGKFEEVILEI
jgi:hypothetical protein